MALLHSKRVLTSAEKLDDHNYRVPVYPGYPSESTSACPIPSTAPATATKKKKLLQPMQSACRSSGERTNVRQRRRAPAAASANDPAHFMPTHCAPSTKNDEARVGGGRRGRSRMRGGGSGERLFNGDADFTWYNSRFTMPRLQGGGCTAAGGAGEMYPAAGCGKATGKMRNNICNEDFLQWDTINPGYLAANKCKLRHVEKSEKSACSCPGKDHLESVLKRKGHSVCTKKPCLGTDCLIKAFKDAQDFVDSIGKVPGLAGLGIVESPYFGKPSESKDIKKMESKQITIIKPPEVTNTLCNTQNIESIRKSNYNAVPNPSNLIKRSPAVQEGSSTFPDSSTYASLKSKKKEERIDKPKEIESNTAAVQINEDSPCGEPKCKSKPKKTATDVTSSESTDKINNLRDKLSALPKNHRKTVSKNVKSASKSSKPTQFDYSYGNSYPTSVYGHKKCNFIRPRVPANMGWMWNQMDTIGKLKPRVGWKPGAISTYLREMLKEAKEGFLNNKRPMSAPSRTKKGGKLQKSMSFGAMKKGATHAEEEVEEDVDFPPTLHIHRKDGVYYVTMYPIKQETTDVPRLDEPVNPLQFKIVKSKDSLASSSTASDMEIEFSPPAAVNRLKKKPNVIHVETQVKQQEILDACKTDLKGKGKDGKSKKDKGKKK